MPAAPRAACTIILLILYFVLPLRCIDVRVRHQSLHFHKRARLNKTKRNETKEGAGSL